MARRRLGASDWEGLEARRLWGTYGRGWVKWGTGDNESQKTARQEVIGPKRQ